MEILCKLVSIAPLLIRTNTNGEREIRASAVESYPSQLRRFDLLHHEASRLTVDVVRSRGDSWASAQ